MDNNNNNNITDDGGGANIVYNDDHLIDKEIDEIASFNNNNNNNNGQLGTTTMVISQPLATTTNTQMTTTQAPTSQPVNNLSRIPLQKSLVKRPDINIITSELILLKHYPSPASCLFVRNMTQNVTKDDLYLIYSPLGYLCDVYKFDDYAIIRYFSVIDAQRAYLETYGKLIDGYPLRVSFSSPKSTREPKPLTHDLAVGLLNHFIGFNGWSSKIDASEVVSWDEHVGEESAKYFSCQVNSQVTITSRDGMQSKSGIAGGFCEYSECQLEALGNAKKYSISNARKEVFKTMAIVIVDNIRLIHFLDQPTDEQVDNNLPIATQQTQQPQILQPN
ncbi:hypothetical protein DFA_03130 [Cavenderia fasciculata]|uniref:RRM domain-containing protein n=1 Tax=Cavenderia fasciculata TaxID=261658 RepID=F4PGQ1_CACFS|nr:uncharacterized protein DFA_03130 [Cavenderia fasciculata]EGG24885.1 hypothetical protein DFA_03130 [Cavenderia fasciculata]|eukprot:XP_004362736.1 hypothetical protein DFA_03130 [Cavenderia fasciculata]